MSTLEYPVVLEPLPDDEGGGFVATMPDLPGCMSDGATPEEALSNVQDAIITWIEAARDLGHEVPAPTLNGPSSSWVSASAITIPRKWATPRRH